MRGLVPEQLRARSRDRRNRHENIKAKRPEPARQRTAEWQQPERVQSDVTEVSVQQRVGEKSPDFRTNAVVDRVRKQRRAITRGDEREREQHLLVDRLG